MGVSRYVPALPYVSLDGRAPPSHQVPPDAAVQIPQNWMVVDAGTLIVTCEPVTLSGLAPAGEPHVVATRAYAPPAISLAPVMPGLDECRLMYFPPSVVMISVIAPFSSVTLE